MSLTSSILINRTCSALGESEDNEAIRSRNSCSWSKTYFFPAIFQNPKLRRRPGTFDKTEENWATEIQSQSLGSSRLIYQLAQVN